jgi:hypothetical protein
MTPREEKITDLPGSLEEEGVVLEPGVGGLQGRQYPSHSHTRRTLQTATSQYVLLNRFPNLYV